MITKEQFKGCGINVKNENFGNAALEWLSKNTTLTVDLNDVETLKALPFAAKIFIEKYAEIFSVSSVVASQQIEGLSMSFNNTDKSTLLWQTAEELLSDYLKGRIKFIPAMRRRW